MSQHDNNRLPEGLTKEYLERAEHTLIALQVARDTGTRASVGPRLLRMREAVDAFNTWCRDHGTQLPSIAEQGRTTIEMHCRDLEQEVAMMRGQFGLPATCDDDWVGPSTPVAAEATQMTLDDPAQ